MTIDLPPPAAPDEAFLDRLTDELADRPADSFRDLATRLSCEVGKVKEGCLVLRARGVAKTDTGGRWRLAPRMSSWAKETPPPSAPTPPREFVTDAVHDQETFNRWQEQVDRVLGALASKAPAGLSVRALVSETQLPLGVVEPALAVLRRDGFVLRLGAGPLADWCASEPGLRRWQYALKPKSKSAPTSAPTTTPPPGVPASTQAAESTPAPKAKPTPFGVPSKLAAFLHLFDGTRTAAEIAQIAGTTAHNVRLYRRRYKLQIKSDAPGAKQQKPRPRAGQDIALYDHLLGVVPDAEIAKKASVSDEWVRRRRVARGIPAARTRRALTAGIENHAAPEPPTPPPAAPAAAPQAPASTSYDDVLGMLRSNPEVAVQAFRAAKIAGPWTAGMREGYGVSAKVEERGGAWTWSASVTAAPHDQTSWTETGTTRSEERARALADESLRAAGCVLA